MSNNKEINEEELLAKASKETEKWVNAWKPVATRDKETALKVLQERTFEGDRVIARVVDSKEEVAAAIRDGAKEVLGLMGEDTSDENVNKHTAGAYSCLWDYYLMAFYESSMTAAEQSHWFTDQTLFPAYEAGLGWVVNLGNLMVGVMLPEEMHKDEDNRIHHPLKAAIKWGNEEQFWWHDVQVEKEWVEDPEGINPVEALAIENAEKRRACCEIVGWVKILDKLNATVIDEDENPMIGTLLEVDLPDSPKTRFVKVLCGTGRTFALPVPNDTETAIQAQALMSQLSEEEVREANEIRT